jgi:hypothetical protein
MKLLQVGIMNYRCQWWRFGTDRRRAFREDAEKRRLNKITTGNRWVVEQITNMQEPPFPVMIVDAHAPEGLRPSVQVEGSDPHFFDSKEAAVEYAEKCEGYRRVTAPDGGFHSLLVPRVREDGDTAQDPSDKREAEERGSI